MTDTAANAATNAAAVEIPAEDVVNMLLQMGHGQIVDHAVALCVNARLTARIRELETRSSSS